MTDGIAADIRLLDGPGFRPYVEQSLSVYAAAMARPPGEVGPRRPIVYRHCEYTGFRAQVALAPDGGMQGFGYGYRGAVGQWWHDVVSRAMPATTAQEWLTASFEVAELHVLPEHQGRGLGRRLLLDLLTGATGTSAVLSTPDTDSRARRLYRSMGFVDLVTRFRFPGLQVDYCVMGRRLPLGPAQAAGGS